MAQGAGGQPGPLGELSDVHTAPSRSRDWVRRHRDKLAANLNAPLKLAGNRHHGFKRPPACVLEASSVPPSLAVPGVAATLPPAARQRVQAALRRSPWPHAAALPGP